MDSHMTSASRCCIGELCFALHTFMAKAEAGHRGKSEHGKIGLKRNLWQPTSL
jgi:hypothetical protein